MHWRLVFWVVATAGMTACQLIDESLCADESCEWTARQWQALQGLTLQAAPAPDPSNAYSTNKAAAALGQRLFFDRNFSGTARGKDAIERPALSQITNVGQPLLISCASCHSPWAAGTDIASPLDTVSVGAGTTDVNALPTLNAAYHKIFFWNGRVDSLWGLSAVVLESKTTMNGTRLRLAHEVAERYAAEFSAIFEGLPPDWQARVSKMPRDGKPGDLDYEKMSPSDRDLATALLVNWAKATAAYEQQLVSKNSPFDRFMAEGPKSSWLSPQARAGARLFVGKAACIDCHNGPLFSDDDFHNIGVPQGGAGVPTLADCPPGGACDCSVGSNCLPWGAFDGLNKLKKNGFLRDSRWSDDVADDSRASYRNRVLGNELKGAWRTPSLRDVALTPPYMHNGVFATLKDVLLHYNGASAATRANSVGTTAVNLKPLHLTDTELDELAAFLASLTGDPLPTSLITPGSNP